MSTKTKTKTSSASTLPDWLTSPYQSAVTQAGTLAAKPAIGAGTASSIAALRGTVANNNEMLNGGVGSLTAMAGGNFGDTALTKAASGGFLRDNPFVADGGLDTGYIDQSGLSRTAAGDFLTPDANPFIKGVAQRGADEAQARINAQFGAAGRANGSGLYAQLFGQGIADAANDVYAANYANERQLQQGAQGTLLSAQQQAREAALGRRMSAYEAERQRQQSAAGGLLSSQLTASGQLPGYLSALLNGDLAAFEAGKYEDGADLTQLGKYSAILSGLAAPFGMQSGTTTQKGSALGTIAGLAGSGLAGWASGGFA